MDKSGKKRILLKIGSNTLTKETNHISRGKIEDIGMQIAALKDDYEFVIVSSGAIAAAKQLNWKRQITKFLSNKPWLLSVNRT